MAEKEDQSFVTPIVAPLCTALRTIINKFGGPSVFFEKLGDQAAEFGEEFAKDAWQLRRSLARLLTDPSFRTEFISLSSIESEREFIQKFLEAWDVWKQLEPDSDEWIRLNISGPEFDALLGPIPARVNDIFRCTTIVQTDSYSDELRIKSAFQLGYSNKNIGNKNVFVTSSSLSSFLQSIHLMMRSLVLEKSSLDVLRLPKDQIQNLTEDLEQIKGVTDVLLKQFQNLG
jgi:hypothetical protein